MDSSASPLPAANRSSALTSAPAAAAGTASISLSAKNQQGEVLFFLQRVADGLYVERIDTPRRGLRVSQCVHFADAASFERWCHNDVVRFDHPLLFASVKRHGEALWRLELGHGND